MKSTTFIRCQQKEQSDEAQDCIFDLLPEANQQISNALTPDFNKTKQVLSSVIGQTDKYGFTHNHEHPQKDRKTLNARIEKWRVMLADFQSQSKQLIKLRVRKGVPDGVRLLVWPLLAGVPEGKVDACLKLNRGRYEDFLKDQFFQFEHQIRLDVLRTFPQNINFQVLVLIIQNQTVLSESLVSVCKALSIAISDMGYCQGLNFLTAALIMVTNDENAFWILYQLMTKYKLADKYKDPSKVYREFYILTQLINQYHPNTAAIIKKYEIDLFYFTTEWFITIYSSILPIDVFYRVFEIFLIEGEKTLFRCALTIISYKEPKLIQYNDFERGLRHMKSTEDLQNIDADQFINHMLTKYKFSKSLLKDLDEKYKKSTKK